MEGHQTSLIIHYATPQLSQFVQWLCDNYDFVSTDQDKNEQLIQYIKVLQQYAKQRRQYIANQLIEKIGKQPIDQYDCCHMYIDDDNVNHYAAASSKQGERTVRIQQGNAYHFVGTGSNWDDCVPTTIASDRIPNIQPDINGYISSVKHTANFEKKTKAIIV